MIGLNYIKKKMKRRKNEEEFDYSSIHLNKLPMNSTFNIDLKVDVTKDIKFSSFVQDFERMNKNSKTKGFSYFY